tara:strand:- start:7099 stop:8346 length:1248 start_codon:yes stop_codon:yes gene_type:complete
MNISRLAWRNIIYNPFNTILSILLMTFGVGVISLLLLLNNQIDKQLQDNLRGIDMVIGAKGSPLQLILSSIYHIDNPTGNISYKEVKKLTKNSIVDLTIPLSYGDSYNGFRIVGTTQEYIDLYDADLSEGVLWDKSMQVVLGSAVADITNLSIGDMFCGTHGFGDDGHVHDHHHYEVVGILKQSNTTIDKLIITDTKSVWDVHNTHEHHTCEDHDHHDHHHADENHNEDIYNSDKFMITSMLVRFKSPVAFIQMPRKVNETTNLQAAMPVLEINRLTNLLGFGVQTINLIALIIIIVSGLSIFFSLYNSLKNRRYELALIRVHGATKLQLIKLVFFEGLTISTLGTIFGLMTSRLILFSTSFMVNQQQMLNSIEYKLITDELWLFSIALFIGLIASLIPAIITSKINIPKVLSNA